MISRLGLFLAAALIGLSVLPDSAAFTTTQVTVPSRVSFVALQARQARKIRDNEIQTRKISNSRRKKLGIAEDEDEYDLDIALDNSTDPFITKVIAGSLILSITALLVAGIIIPATTDYGEGLCNALLTGGRC